MSQGNNSALPLFLRLCITFLVLIICINNNPVVANDMDEAFYLDNSIPEEFELTRRGVWSRLFRHENSPARMNNHLSYPPTAMDNGHSNAQIHIIPFDKRAIPIELQKALYAHGIVGRRRRR